MSLTRKIWDGMWTGTAASVVENALRIPRMMVITRVLGPEFYGILGLFGVFREVVGKFIQLGTGDAVIQFLASAKAVDDRKRIGATMQAAGLIRLITIAICLGLVLMFDHEIVQWMNRYPATQHVSYSDMIWLIRLLLIGIIVQALEGPFGNALQGFQAWRSLLIVCIVGALASTGLPVAAAFLGFHLLGIVCAQQIAFIIIALAICYFYYNKVHSILEFPGFSESVKAVKPVLLFGLPLIFSQIFRLVYTYTDQLMLAGMGNGPEHLSYYEVARNAATMLVFIPTLLRSVMFPASAEFHAGRSIQRLEALFTFMVKHLFWLLLPLAAWMSVLSPLAIDIIAGSKYLPAAQALSWLAMLVVMRSFGVPFFTCLVGALGRTKDQFYIAVSGGALNVLLNFFWIPKYGFMGAVYATATGHMLSFSLAYLFLTPHMKLNFPIRSMLVCILCTALTSFILYWAFELNKILALCMIPLATILYMLGIIRLGIFDRQDLAYLDRLISPVRSRMSFLWNYLERFALPTCQKNKL